MISVFAVEVFRERLSGQIIFGVVLVVVGIVELSRVA
jgi:uncharacterized membrane protein